MESSSVQRIVITSSCAAILDVKTEKCTASEADWNEAAATECKAKGSNASPESKLRASKALSEKGG